MDTLGERIKTLRTNKGFTQETLGEGICTASAISQIENGEWRSVWYWGFTKLSLERLFAGAFPDAEVEIAEFGNVLTSIAFLEGLVAEEFTADELAYRDELYPLLLGLRATKAS